MPGIDEDIVRRAADAGMEVLVLTVDSQVRTKRERDLRNGFSGMGVKTGPMLEALLHPAWLAGYLASGRTPRFGNFAPYATDPNSARAVSVSPSTSQAASAANTPSMLKITAACDGAACFCATT